MTFLSNHWPSFPSMTFLHQPLEEKKNAALTIHSYPELRISVWKFPPLKRKFAFKILPSGILYRSSSEGQRKRTIIPSSMSNISPFLHQGRFYQDGQICRQHEKHWNHLEKHQVKSEQPSLAENDLFGGFTKMESHEDDTASHFFIVHTFTNIVQYEILWHSACMNYILDFEWKLYFALFLVLLKRHSA